ncbi:MAG: helix-turn-helix domain-containing protein [Pseudomonadota bacterium]
MKDLSTLVRDRRRRLGITQAHLCTSAGVSRATLQNLEAGRANPAVGTLLRILDELGLGLECPAQPADWDALCALGLPLLAREARSVERCPEVLARHLHCAVAALSDPMGGPVDGRQHDALRALLLALRDHFPRIFRDHLAHAPGITDLLDVPWSGREIKLTRIARRSLAEYL